MPRFYFDVREGARFIPDGRALSSTAWTPPKTEAACAAAEIGRDRLPEGDTRDVTVEVRNEHGQRVLTVTVCMEIDRVDPSPLPRARETACVHSQKALYGTLAGAICDRGKGQPLAHERGPDPGRARSRESRSEPAHG
jgi:hypothetical protein